MPRSNKKSNKSEKCTKCHKYKPRHSGKSYKHSQKSSCLPCPPCPNPCGFVADAIANAFVSSVVVSSGNVIINIFLNNPPTDPMQLATIIFTSPYGTASQVIALTGSNVANFVLPLADICPFAGGTGTLSLFVPNCPIASKVLILPAENVSCTNYGISFQPTGLTSAFWSISDTGAGTFIGIIPLRFTSALDINPTNGLFYAIGADPGPGNPRRLVTIDPNTAAITSSVLTQNGTWADMSFNSAGVLYAVDSQGGAPDLYTITLGGAATFINDLPAGGGNALSFNCDGRLFFTNNPGVIVGDTSVLYQLDPSDGTVLSSQLINFVGFPAGPTGEELRFNAMDYSRCFNSMLGIVISGKDAVGGTFLATLDVNTATATFLGNTVPRLDAITIAT